MAEIISGIYKIINIITGDFYIGSSNNIKRRWENHKCPSRWKKHPNNPLYKDMQKYGVDKFELQILAEAEIEHLKEAEQRFIEKLKPVYNDRNSNGFNINKYQNQLCLYKGKTLTLHALYARFQRAGIKNPTAEAKKYLIL